VLAGNALIDMMTPMFEPKESGTFDSISVETTASFLGCCAVEMLGVDRT